MKIYTDTDASIKPMAGKTAAIFGYGNQGRAQALNLQDSGVEVVVGNRQDSYLEQARADSFDPLPIKEAAEAGDYPFILTTDESQPLIWDEQIAVRDIKEGAFAQEWTAEQAGGSKTLDELKAKAFNSDMSRAEAEIIPIIQQAHRVELDE